MTELPITPYHRLVHKFEPQSKLVRAWELKGGVSAQVTALEIERADGERGKWVVRQHGAIDRQQNPNIAADEFRLLQILQAAELSAPKPYYLDVSNWIFPTPYVVIEFVEGQTEFAPVTLTKFAMHLAGQLAQIHNADYSIQELSFLPLQSKIVREKLDSRPAKLDDSIDEGRIRVVLEAHSPLKPRNRWVLLHGDFWPGNVLWKDEQVTAVIDWEDAKIGDPLADLGISRLDMLWAFGVEAMQQFTQQYRGITTIDFTDLPYWDLWAALRPAFKISEWAANADAEKTMRERHRWFVMQAFEKLVDKG